MMQKIKSAVCFIGVAVMAAVLLTGCGRKSYQDKQWSTFDFSAQQWLDKVKALPPEQALTVDLPEKLEYVAHGRTKNKAEFTIRRFAEEGVSNLVAPHIGISGVVQGDKLGLLVYYSTKEKDTEYQAADTRRNVNALLLSLAPPNSDQQQIQTTVAAVLDKAKKSTLSMAQEKFGDIQVAVKYGSLKLRNSITNQDENVDSVFVSFCNGEDCK